MKAMGAAAAFLRLEAEAGALECWRLADLWLMTRVEQGEAGRELVIVCAEGRGLGRLGDEIMRVARRAGCQSIRFHAAGDSRHLARMGRYYRRELGRYAPRLVEQVYSIGVTDGQ